MHWQAIQHLKSSHGKNRCCCYTHLQSHWVFHSAIRGQDQTSVVHKAVSDWSLLATHAPFTDWSLYVISWPFPSTEFAENLTSGPPFITTGNVLCKDALPSGEQQQGKHSSSWVTVGKCHHLTTFLLLQNNIPNSDGSCSMLQNSLCLGKDWSGHLSLAMKRRCWRAPLMLTMSPAKHNQTLLIQGRRTSLWWTSLCLLAKYFSAPYGMLRESHIYFLGFIFRYLDVFTQQQFCICWSISGEKANAVS